MCWTIGWQCGQSPMAQWKVIRSFNFLPRGSDGVVGTPQHRCLGIKALQALLVKFRVQTIRLGWAEIQKTVFFIFAPRSVEIPLRFGVHTPSHIRTLRPVHKHSANCGPHTQMHMHELDGSGGLSQASCDGPGGLPKTELTKAGCWLVLAGWNAVSMRLACIQSNVTV